LWLQHNSPQLCFLTPAHEALNKTALVSSAWVPLFQLDRKADDERTTTIIPRQGDSAGGNDFLCGNRYLLFGPHSPGTYRPGMDRFHKTVAACEISGSNRSAIGRRHAYAYGGCAIQDMGYYPFGKRFFSDLTHYVRSGDFVVWLFRNARTIDEYAFAIGALSHYLGDSIGHSEAINPATAIAFPKLGRKFGSKVTYDESPHGHIRTEFAFDIDELTNTAFAPPAYLRFIGLRVPAKFLEQAFVNTYGFDIHEVLGRAHPALRSYRTSVRSFIPSFAEAEVVLHRHQFPTHPDDEAYRIFAERVARTNYERRWKHTYRGPGFKAHLLAVLVFIVPKIGGASDLAIKIPTSDTQEWYLRSVNHTVDVFHQELNKLAANEAFARRYRPRHRGTRQVGRLSAHRQDIFRTA
jgi:hypothetical protein